MLVHVAGACALPPPSPPPQLTHALAHAMGASVAVARSSGRPDGSGAGCMVGEVCSFELQIPLESAAHAACGVAVDVSGSRSAASASDDGAGAGAHIVAHMVGHNALVHCSVAPQSPTHSSPPLPSYIIRCIPHDPGEYRLRSTVVYIAGSDVQPPAASPHLLPLFVGYHDVPLPPPVIVLEQQQQQQQQKQQQQPPLCFSSSARHIPDTLAYKGRWISATRCSECSCSHVHSQVFRCVWCDV